MKRKKVMEFNLAEMDTEGFTQMLKDNEADQGELYAILEALFQMWASALQFSAAAVTYGEEHHEEFIETFLQNMGPKHGVSPERMISLMKMVRDKRRPPDTRLH